MRDTINQTPASVVESAYADIQSMTDDGAQMHLRAVQGRPVEVVVNGWDRWMNNGQGGRSITLRVHGQTLARAQAYCSTTETAEAFADACRRLIDLRGVPVAGPVYVRPARIRNADLHVAHQAA